MPHLLSRRPLGLISLATLLAVVFVSMPAAAQLSSPLQLRTKTGSKDAKVETRLVPADAKPGDEVTLEITLTPPPGSYVYSMDPGFGGATKAKLTQTQGLESLGEFTADHPPKKEFIAEFDQEVEKYHEAVTWSRKFRLQPSAKPEDVAIAGTLDYQICDATTCRQIRTPLAVTLVAGEKAAPARPFYFEAKPGKAGKPQPVTIQAQLRPADPKPGERVTLEVTAVIQDGWHIYSTTQKPDNAATATEIEVEEVRGLKPVSKGFEPERAPEIKRPDPEIEQEIFHDRITWSQTFEVPAGGTIDNISVAGRIRYQACDAIRCLTPTNVNFTLQGAQRGAAIDSGTKGPAVVALEEDTKAAGAITDPRERGLLYVLGSAFVAGFLALLTPCVFPMVPITVSFFLKQSEKEHHRPVTMALVYCAAIIATFTFLGLVMSFIFGATAINELANAVWLNLFLAGVLIFFALNLLGLFEIRVPGWLLTYTAGKESAGGYIGVIFMALTFTLTSFTCTFAFLGLILVWSAQGDFWWPVAGLLAFSAAFALPFFLLALFPSYLQKLPKSGGWMNKVKVVMGLVELAFVFKFLSVADVSWHSEPVLFDYHLVMSAWMIISITAGMYLLGLFRLAHDTVSDHVGAFPVVVAMSFLGLGGYLAVGLFAAEKPHGRLWEKIAAFAPPVFEGGMDETGPYLVGKHDGLKYLLDFDRAIAHAKKANQPVFLDFTGVNCINCRLMEKRMAQPRNHERLKDLVRIQLYTDEIPKVDDPKLAERLLELNRERQEAWFGDTTLPAYAVVTPDGQQILARFSGLEQREGDFARFLDEGLTRWQQQAQMGDASLQASMQ